MQPVSAVSFNNGVVGLVHCLIGLLESQSKGGKMLLSRLFSGGYRHFGEGVEVQSIESNAFSSTPPLRIGVDGNNQGSRLFTAAVGLVDGDGGVENSVSACCAVGVPVCCWAWVLDLRYTSS